MTLKLNGTNSVAAPAYAGDDADTGLQCGTDELKLVTGGSARATVDSSGNVGIGTTSPSSKTHIKGGSLTVEHASPSTGTCQFNINSENNSQVSLSYDDQGSIVIGTAATPSNQGSFSEKLRIDSSGNVGIGKTSSGNKLEIEGQGNTKAVIDARTDASNGSLASLELWSKNGSGTNNFGQIEYDGDGNFIIGSGGSGGSNVPITFRHGGTERARFNSTGDFLVGTTNHSPGLGNTNNGCQISAASHIAVSRSSGQPAYFNRNTSTGTIVSLHYNGAERGRISTDGTVIAYNTSSDYRLKENIVDLDGAITRVKQLQPRRFNFIEAPSKTVDGFVAHEAQTVVPEAVTGTHNGLEVWSEGEELPEGVSVGDNKLDEEGNTIPEYQGIDQSKLVPLLTAALQEAIAKIETLETKVAALEGAS